VDGTSLTVVDVLDAESSFTFMLVAYTQQHIVIPLKKVGDKVNLGEATATVHRLRSWGSTTDSACDS
jgi:riboflavin synthase alpha subunit